MRPLLRVLAAAAITVPLAVAPILLVAEPLTALHRRGLFLAGWGHDDYDRVINMIVGPLFGAGIVIGIVLAARWIDKRPLADYGLRLDRAWWTSLGGGFAIGALLMTLVFAAEWAAGWVAIVGTGFSLSLMSFTIVKVLCVGVYEEVVARGYLLRNIGVIGPRSSSPRCTPSTTTRRWSAPSASSSTACCSPPPSWSPADSPPRSACTWPGTSSRGSSTDSRSAATRSTPASSPCGGAFGPEAGVMGIAASLAGIAVLYSARAGVLSKRTLVNPSA